VAKRGHGNVSVASFYCGGFLQIDWPKVQTCLRQFGKDEREMVFRWAVCNPVSCSISCDQNEPDNDYHNCLYWSQFNQVLRQKRLQEMLDGRGL